MPEATALWPARLHHLAFESADPEAKVAFYRDGLGLEAAPDGPGRWTLVGGERRLVIQRGERGGLAHAAYGLDDGDRLEALRGAVESRGIAAVDAASPFFRKGAFSVSDPDGNRLVFGVAEAFSAPTDRLPGRLQHLVVATTALAPMVTFYRDGLGFVVSDWVREASGEATVCFLRSDPEHHSFAAFRAPEAGLDHHAYEATSWNDIRDWADHFASLGVPLSWGPGRHGPGNNLFLMVRDPDEKWVEISAEIEHLPLGMAAREWRHEERTLNYWGQAFMRS